MRGLKLTKLTRPRTPPSSLFSASLASSRTLQGHLYDWPDLVHCVQLSAVCDLAVVRGRARMGARQLARTVQVSPPSPRLVHLGDGRSKTLKGIQRSYAALRSSARTRSGRFGATRARSSVQRELTDVDSPGLTYRPSPCALLFQCARRHDLLVVRAVCVNRTRKGAR